jgi:hypothetical protein
MSGWYSENVPEDIAKMLITLRFPVQDGLIERDFRPDVEIDYEDLVKQLEETPAIFSFWANLLAEVRKQVAVIERKATRRRGEVTRTLLDEAKQAGVKLRRDDVEDLIEADDLLNKFEAELVIANRHMSKLFAITDALKMKSEHLRSLAGFKRQEQRDS